MAENFEKDFEFEKLVIMSLDGTITEDDFRRLNDLLARDSSARDKYFDLLKINQSLCSYANILSFLPDGIGAEHDGHEAFSDTASNAIDCPEVEKPGSSDNVRSAKLGRSNLATFFLKIAAVAMVFTLGIWFANSFTGQKPQPFQKLVSVATLDVVRGVTFDGGEVLQAGDRLFINQEIRLLTGSARLRFDNNADVLLQAPVSLRLKGEKLLYLEEGKLTVSAPASAKGFTVLTPVAEVVDYGTEFGVTVDESGETETSVFEGEVDLRPATDNASYKPQRITSGWSSKVDSEKKPAGELTRIGENLYQRLSFNVNINFQPKVIEVPKGSLMDYGSVFADRGNGYSYGWSRDLTGDDVTKPPRHRPYRIEYDDRRYDTLIHISRNHAFWEIAVPNGTYKVNLVMGDPIFSDQVNNVMIEGVVLNDPDGRDNFDMYYDVTVVVTDGRLTLKEAPGADNTKVCFIEIEQL